MNLSDPYVVEFIQNIHVPILAFTTNCSGSLNKIPYLEVRNLIKLVNKALKKFNMYFKSVLYLDSREVTGRPNEEAVKFQQCQLIETGKWHEDDEASKLLDFQHQQENSGSDESQ